jgi:hypothetical protein
MVVEPLRVCIIDVLLAFEAVLEGLFALADMFF